MIGFLIQYSYLKLTGGCMAFIIEVVIICIVFTIACISSTDRMMKNLDLVKLDYPEAIVNRLIEQGRISDEKPLTLFERVKKKWPAIIVFGVIIGLIVRYANGCITFKDGFLTSYLIWIIVDWYDALILDCGWFCHSKKVIIPGTEDLKDAYHDYMFHIKGSLAGMLIGLPCCLIAGVICALI